MKKIRWPAAALVAITLAGGASVAYFASAPSPKVPQIVERDGMMWVPGGQFLMGSDHKLAQDNERPAHRVKVDGFWMDRYHVTNAEFRKFVEATGYVTTAEKKPDWETLEVQLPPGTPRPPESALVPGAMVFVGTEREVKLERLLAVVDATSRARTGSSRRVPAAASRARTITRSCRSRTRTRRPTRSGSASACRPRRSGSSPRAAASSRRPTRGATTSHPTASRWPTIWDVKQGRFPVMTVSEGYRNVAGRDLPAERLRPARHDRQRLAVGRGLVRLRSLHGASQARQASPIRTGPSQSYDPDDGGVPVHAPKRVTRGGSFLCNVDYCLSYRPSARRGNDPYNPMSHIGFRLVEEGGAK